MWPRRGSGAGVPTVVTPRAAAASVLPLTTTGPEGPAQAGAADATALAAVVLATAKATAVTAAWSRMIPS